jgi:hypothetical protein
MSKAACLFRWFVNWICLELGSLPTNNLKHSLNVAVACMLPALANGNQLKSSLTEACFERYQISLISGSAVISLEAAAHPLIFMVHVNVLCVLV